MDWFQSLLDDNGGYFLSAYGIVLGTLGIYAWRLYARWVTLERDEPSRSGQS